MANDRDPNLYFSTPGPFTIDAPQPSVVCPMGRIIYAGTKWNSRATYAHAPPPDFMRPAPHFLVVYTLEGRGGLRGQHGRQNRVAPRVSALDQARGAPKLRPETRSALERALLMVYRPAVRHVANAGFPGRANPGSHGGAAGVLDQAVPRHCRALPSHLHG